MVSLDYYIFATQLVPFPNPELHVGIDEKSALRSHDKGALVVTLQPPHWRQQVQVVNLHALPFHRFGLAEDSAQAASVWWGFERNLRKAVAPGCPHVLVGGDFNASKRQIVDRRSLSNFFRARPGFPR